MFVCYMCRLIVSQFLRFFLLDFNCKCFDSVVFVVLIILHPSAYRFMSEITL